MPLLGSVTSGTLRVSFGSLYSETSQRRVKCLLGTRYVAMCARGRVWWGRNKRHDIVVEPRLVQYIHTFREPAAHIQVLNYASANDALGSGRKRGCSGYSRLLGGGGLACHRWRRACLEDAVFPVAQVAAPRPRREGPRPLQAASRRRLELRGVLGRGITLGCCGSGCAATSSSSLSHAALKVQRLSVAMRPS